MFRDTKLALDDLVAWTKSAEGIAVLAGLLCEDGKPIPLDILIYGNLEHHHHVTVHPRLFAAHLESLDLSPDCHDGSVVRKEMVEVHRGWQPSVDQPREYLITLYIIPKGSESGDDRPMPHPAYDLWAYLPGHQFEENNEEHHYITMRTDCAQTALGKVRDVLFQFVLSGELTFHRSSGLMFAETDQADAVRRKVVAEIDQLREQLARQ